MLHVHKDQWQLKCHKIECRVLLIFTVNFEELLKHVKGAMALTKFQRILYAPVTTFKHALALEWMQRNDARLMNVCCRLVCALF